MAFVYEEQYGEATSCLQSLYKQLKRTEALSVQKCSFARVSTREGGLKVIWAICASSIVRARCRIQDKNLEQCKISKDSWRFINHLLNRKTTTTTINQITVNGRTITGNENIANGFNNYFCEIGPKLAQTIPPSNVDPLQYITANSNKFTCRQISPVELCRILDGIKLGKAAGLDKITNKLLKTRPTLGR